MAKISFAKYEQAMGCLSCGLAGFTPEAHFPQEPGLWDRPCPKCGEEAVWVTEVTERDAVEAQAGADR